MVKQFMQRADRSSAIRLSERDELQGDSNVVVET
jgi:hypothetical protein